jgi:phosphoglycolate phosphatase
MEPIERFLQLKDLQNAYFESQGSFGKLFGERLDMHDKVAVTRMKYQLAIFDFDGTLADTADSMFTEFNRAAIRFGFRQTAQQEIETLRGMRSPDIIRFLGIPLWKLPMIAVYMRQTAGENAERTRLFPGTREMLARLASDGIALAIVTSNSEENVRSILGPGTAGLISYFECGASLFGKAAKFKTVLKRSGIEAASAIAIGDESRDMEAAKTAGVAAGAVTWGYATSGLLRSCAPTEIFESLEEIPARLRG